MQFGFWSLHRHGSRTYLSRTCNPQSFANCVTVGRHDAVVGDGSLTMMAGPCSVESRDQNPRSWTIDPVMGDVVKDPRYAALLKKYGLDK